MTEHEPLLAALDLPAKVRLLTGASMFTLAGDEAVALAPMAFSDGPTGVRGLQFSGGREVSLLPCATVLASSWSEEVLHEVGELLAEEAARQEVHVVLGPTINLHRSPLGGRLFEAYSEDPLLTGRLAAAYVRGVQERGVGACLKHLVANESETERHTVDSRVDEATLREVYLLPFEIAVADADPWSVMAAYNRVNGVPATEQHDLLEGVLKGEWGWPGLVVSDWFATTSTAASANGGLDLVMPGPRGPWGEALVGAVEAGEVAEGVVDEHVRRLLRLAERVGALGGPRPAPRGLPEPTDPVRREALVRYAAAGATLLVNDGVLPLDGAARVALVGRPAVATTLMGGGSAQVRPPHQVSVAQGLLAAAPGRVQVVDGVEVRTLPVRATAGFVVDPRDGRPGARFVLEADGGQVLADEHRDDTQRLVGFDDELAAPAFRARLSARIEHTGPVQVGVIGLGSWTLTAGTVTREVVLSPVTGDHGEGVLTPPTWTAVVQLDGPTVLQAQVSGLPASPGGAPGPLASMLGLIARPAPRPDADVIAEAVAAARDADVAVVVVGLTEEQETEARDKTTLALPGAQDALVEAVAAAAPHTVVVVNAATPVLMPWLERVDAVLVAGLPGQEGGTAIAAALVGDLEPAGRLVTTWPTADGATPAWSVTPVDGALPYTEGPFVGYRGHAAGRAPAPLFWFGAGLGYGSWDYQDARVEGWSDAGAPRVAVALRNTSARTSREVVQVYFAPTDPAQPVRLTGWAAVEVAPGESAEVTVACDARTWRRWDTAAGGWAPLERAGELLVARGLGDVRHRLPVG